MRNVFRAVSLLAVLFLVPLTANAAPHFWHKHAAVKAVAAPVVPVVTATGPHSVVLAWVEPAPVTTGLTVQPAAASFNVYRAPGTCGLTGQVFAVINTAPITTTGYTDSSAVLVANAAFCYSATAVSATGIESAQSVPAQAVIPGPPSAPTGVAVQAQ